MRPDYRFPSKPIDNPDHISILIPTRARPEKIKRVFECFRETIENKHLVDVWLYVDDDDELTLQYIKSEEWRQYDIQIIWYVGKPTKSMGDMLNHLWQKCTTNPGLYFPFCDDYIIQTPRWDVILRESISRYQDGVMLGYLIDPGHAPYQVTIPVPSAQWLNTLGYFITNRFYYWFDDMWLDRIAATVQRKVLIPIRVLSQGEKDKTPRIKNLSFWNRYFECTVDDRLEDADKLLEVIHNNDSTSLKSALQNAREEAFVQIYKGCQFKPDSERKTELAQSDPQYVPSAAQLLNYLATELNAVEDLMLKVQKAIVRKDVSDALFLLDALELSSFNISDIDYIKALLFQDSGYSVSAAEFLHKHLDKQPEDVKSLPLYTKINSTLAASSIFERTDLYLSAWLGITNDRFIFFPSKIDEELYFLIQSGLFFILNNGQNLNSILVVGAGSGEGTVQAIVSAYRNIKPNLLLCIEPDFDKFQKLEHNYSHTAQVYNTSSVAAARYVAENELTAFYKYVPSILNNYPLENFIAAREHEIQYLEKTNRSFDTITDLKRIHSLERFDFVILDGSMYSGEADLDAVYGANIIFLTSVQSIKDFANHKRLSQDDAYQLVTEKIDSRTGYSVFRRKDY